MSVHTIRFLRSKPGRFNPHGKPLRKVSKLLSKYLSHLEKSLTFGSYNFNNNRGIYDASLKKLAASEKQTSQDLHTAATDLHQLRQQLHLDK